MGQRHTREMPAGVLPKGVTVLDMFQTDVLHGILYLDNRCGLGLISAATQLMNYRTSRGFRIQRVSAAELNRIRGRVNRRVSRRQRERSRRAA